MILFPTRPHIAMQHDPEILPKSEIDSLLEWVNEGDQQATERLFNLTYKKLERQARLTLRRESYLSDSLLEADVLVNETVLRFLDVPRGRFNFQDEHHFFSIMSHLMRRVLIEYARKRNSLKRGGGVIPVALEEVANSLTVVEPRIELIDLDQALERLATLDPREARVVELKFFGGFTDEEIASTLDLSDRTVTRLWDRARHWLKRELSDKKSAEGQLDALS